MKATTRRQALLGALAAPSAVVAPTEAASVLYLEQKPGPMTVRRARQIADQFMLDDGPLRPDDVTGTTAFADWERSRLTAPKA